MPFHSAMASASPTAYTDAISTAPNTPTSPLLLLVLLLSLESLLLLLVLLLLLLASAAGAAVGAGNRARVNGAVTTDAVCVMRCHPRDHSDACCCCCCCCWYRCC